MRFAPSLLDDIKARLPVSEVVGRRVRLVRAGREWKGLSPFNAEKTPSFFVNDQKERWFDFSANRNGNIFDFVMATEGLSFTEAVERLAAEAGVPLPAASAEDEAREKKRAGLHEVLEYATAFFEATLQGREGARARGYLADRGIAASAVKEFRLGHALEERFALRDHLAAKGASVETMIEAGLLVHGDDVAVPYDRFRGRVMFPIADRGGRVIAFGGRALDPDAPAKYLNSPETPLFHKGAVLYNHHRARIAARDKGTVIAVEGYVDAIAMTGAGFPHTVAPLGTALTPDQCELLWRMAPEPILCFDGDRAGRKAAYRAIELTLPLIRPDRSLRFAMLPAGQDPDDVVRSGGSAVMVQIIDSARPLVEMLWARELETVPLDTPERRAGFERRLAEALRQISDEALRRHYRAEIDARLAALFGAGRGSGGPRASSGIGPGWRSRRSDRRAGRGAQPAPRLGYAADPPTASPGLLHTPVVRHGAGLPPREVRILLVALNHPDLLRRHAEDLAGLDLANRDLARLRDALVTLAAEPIEDHLALKQAVDAMGLVVVRKKIEDSAADLSFWCVRPEAAPSDAAATFAQALTLHHRARALHNGLKSAELRFANENTEASFAELQQILAEISAIEGVEAMVDGFGTQSGHASRDV